MHAARLFAALALTVPLGGLPAQTAPEILLRYAEFDPTVSQPVIPTGLLAEARGRLHIVQFEGLVGEAQRDELRALGVRLLRYLPRQSYVARLDPARAQRIDELPFVRWVSPMHRAYRLAPDVIFDLLADREMPPRRYTAIPKTTDDECVVS